MNSASINRHFYLLLLLIYIGKQIDGLQIASNQHYLESVVPSGWIRIDKNWPLQEESFFIATGGDEKAHPAKLKINLPMVPNEDFGVELEYMISYDSISPDILISGCQQKPDWERTNLKGKFVKQTWQFDHTRCKQRDDISITINFDERESLFAWKLLRVKTLDPVERETMRTTKKPGEVDEQVSVETPRNPGKIPEKDGQQETQTTEPPKSLDQNQSTEKDTIVPKPEAQVSEPNKPLEDVEGSPETSVTSEGSTEVEDGSSAGNESTPESNTESTAEIDQNSNDSAATMVRPQVDQVTSNDSDANEAIGDSKGSSVVDESKNTLQQQDSKQSTISVHENQESSSKPEALSRKRRSIISRNSHFRPNIQPGSTSIEQNLLDKSCNIDYCDETVFYKSENFFKVAKRIPESFIADLQDDQVFMSQGFENFTLKMESGEDFSSLDVCFNFRLLLEQGSHIETILESNIEPKEIKTLDNLETKACEQSQTDSQWLKCNYCIQDFMPRMFKKDSNVNQAKLRLKPQDDKHIFIRLSTHRAVTWRRMDSILNLLPDIVSQSKAASQSQWKLVGSGSLSEPDSSFVSTSSVSDELARYIANPVVHMRDIRIGSGQTSFTLKSGWIKLDSYTQKLSRLVYRIKKPNWLETINLEVKRSSGCNVKKLYPYLGPERQADQLRGPMRDIIEMFVDITKLEQEDEFQLQLIHHLKQSTQTPTILDLDIVSLGYGDRCIMYNETYCLNGGTCKTDGSKSGICTCKPGYTLPRCNGWDPCQAKYGLETGKEHCEEMGAKCVSALDYVRCKWEDDKYFTPNFWLDGDKLVMNTTKSPANEKVGADSDGSAGNIAMIVLFVAVIILLIVIIIGMIQRLQKVNAKLRLAEGEMLEMTQRSSRQRSSVSTRPIGKRINPPLTTLSYQNQSFDAAP